MAYLLHHRFFLRKGAALKHTKLVVAGSYRTGGAGKTPFCIWLAHLLESKGKKVAILCHQYAYDEFKIYQQEFAASISVKIFSTKNRYKTAHEIDQTQSFDFILCDDGFEDSRLNGATTILLDWGESPAKISDLWPTGTSRSLRKDHNPDLVLNCHDAPKDVQFRISRIINFVENRNSTPPATANIACGLGDPNRFISDIQESGIHIRQKFIWHDHQQAFSKKIKTLIDKYPEENFIISLKDAIRLEKTDTYCRRIYIARQSTLVSARAQELIENSLHL